MSVARTIWTRLENHPWLTMTLAVLAQTWFTLNNRALWFSDEVRYADAYRNLAQGGKWMVLALNGQAYPDKPPVYFWFLWLIDKLTPLDPPAVFFAGAACSGLFFLFAAYALARTLKFDRTTSLASSLILISTFMVAALLHYSRMDLMFAGLIILSHAAFYRAYTDRTEGWWPVWGFALAGAATLVKGPLGFLFPLMNVALFLAFKGELKRLFSRRTGLGLLVMLTMLAAWVAGVILAEGPRFLIDTVLGKQILERATHTFHHKESWWWYFAAFPLAWLPWTLAVFAAPLRRLLSLSFWGELWGGRRQAGARTFLWIMFLATFIFLSSLSGKVFIYVLPMFPPLAILIADDLRTMSEVRARRLWTLVGGLWIVVGAALLLVGDLIPLPVPVHGMGICAAVLVLGGGAIVTVRAEGFRAALLTCALAMILWIHPVGLLAAPSLDDAMSPKRQALVLKDYIERGYAPFSARVYSGIYTWYADHDYPEYDNYAQLMEEMAKHDKVVLVMRESHWRDIEDKLPEFHVVDRQSIAGLVHILAIKG
ncbi:glycosyl transferase family 39 [Pseudodesulfovibrio mercurii]|uniref:Glycosyl transferase family 39 n=1 Tax=Pseudodesulfovibrio mercurii TaxID=641491 RepID=F0JKN7_9BACT|nr:glycosyltransferase family 39 protein [Pseudodesulfovibrio mercurii]EGB16486.1 glycosyl transferase family 39 [Pseudodesulfovibrio mercurii]